MANYADKKKEELVDEARNRDLSGYSTMNKEELVTLLEEDDTSKGQEGGTTSVDQGQQYLEEEKAKIEKLEDETTDPDFEVQAAHHSEASDLDNPDVVANLSPSGQEAVDTLSETEKAEADAALDASGPLHLQPADERVMTGALTEKHGEEQRERVQMPEGGHTGGFSESGEPLNLPPDYSEVGSKKDNLGPDDDRELYEVRPEDVIDFPPPLKEREDAEEAKAGTELTTSGSGAGDVYSSKAVLYTDGLGGEADHNLDRAYDLPTKLQPTDEGTYTTAQGKPFDFRRNSEAPKNEQDGQNTEASSDDSQDENKS